jgi:hypothetical protein
MDKVGDNEGMRVVKGVDQAILRLPDREVEGIEHMKRSRKPLAGVGILFQDAAGIEGCFPDGLRQLLRLLPRRRSYIDPIRSLRLGHGKLKDIHDRLVPFLGGFLKALGNKPRGVLIEEELQRLQIRRRQKAAQRFELDDRLPRFFKELGVACF